jgi:hypothetical protein
LKILNSKIVDGKLSIEETSVITAHLRNNYSTVFSLLSDAQLYRLISDTPVTVFPTATQEFGATVPKEDLIYIKDEGIDICTLILSGKVVVLVGADQFRSDVPSWTLLAAGALEKSDYVPDFSAFVSVGPCRCIRISRSRFTSAADSSVVERTESNRTSSSQPETSTAVLEKESRKTKLVNALQSLVDNDGKQKEKVSKLRKNGASSVAFAEPAALRRSSSMRPTLSLPSVAVTPPTLESTPSRFGFIKAPSKREAKGQTNSLGES